MAHRRIKISRKGTSESHGRFATMLFFTLVQRRSRRRLRSDDLNCTRTLFQMFRVEMSGGEVEEEEEQSDE